MSTGIFNKSLSYNQILYLVKQLPLKDKANLCNELAKEAIDVRLSRLLNSFKTNDLEEKIIDEEVEKVRAELYAGKKGK
ncbi:MAG: hypothetical protein K8R37_16390 [Bacteroidales bacterium]|nr:hypothetical protein [Bacteroidales bacterium]